MTEAEVGLRFIPLIRLMEDGFSWMSWASHSLHDSYDCSQLGVCSLQVSFLLHCLFLKSLFSSSCSPSLDRNGRDAPFSHGVAFGVRGYE